MEVRIEIDKPNGKAFTTDIDDSNYDFMRELLLKLRLTSDKNGIVEDSLL